MDKYETRHFQPYSAKISGAKAFFAFYFGTHMMARPIFEKALRDLLHRDPFKPFLIQMDDGRRWVVNKRENLSYYVGDSAVYVGPDKDWWFVDCDNVSQIVELGA